MKNKITLSGYAGSGKSTVGNEVAKLLNYEFKSIGNYTREIAEHDFQMTINEFQMECRLNPNLDHRIDKQFTAMCNTGDRMVIDYRLGFHFIKEAFHVLLKVSDKIASERLNKANRKNEDIRPLDITIRNQQMKERFEGLYEVDFSDHENYDMVVNTDDLTSQEIAQLITKHFFTHNQRQQIPSINFHLWEPCNMRCKFCFATFQDVKQSILPKGHLPVEDAIKIVKNIAQAGFEKITFAGGEPLLCKWLPILIKTAKQLGMTTMIVTNGSKLNDDFLKNNKPYLDWIAVSIDSLNDENNLEIGRAIIGKKALGATYYYELIDKIHKYGYGLKINTVVNKVNYKEDFVSFINHARPKRWKVLQVLPILGQNDKNIDDFKITDVEYRHFLNTHQSVPNMIPESNEEIKGSYVMVDPAGRLFDNAAGTHNYSKPILDVGIDNALKQMNYDIDKFNSRGGIYQWKNLSIDNGNHRNC